MADKVVPPLAKKIKRLTRLTLKLPTLITLTKSELLPTQFRWLHYWLHQHRAELTGPVFPALKARFGLRNLEAIEAAKQATPWHMRGREMAILQENDILFAHKALNIMSGLTEATRRVAGAIIDHFNKQTGQCDPSIERLATLLVLIGQQSVRQKSFMSLD